MNIHQGRKLAQPKIVGGEIVGETHRRELTHSQIRRKGKLDGAFVDALSPECSVAGVHEHLKAWRRLAGLTQTNVADKLGVDTSTVSNWERGTRDMDLSDLKRLAEAYGLESPIVLLFAPQDHDKAKRLSRAFGVISDLDENIAEQWLGMGEHLVKGS